MERRFTSETGSVALEERDGAPPKIVGYAAVFYDARDAGTEYELWPGAKERILPTAFDRALADGDDVRALFNHDPNNLLGRTTAGTMKLEKFAKGLRYTINPPNTQLGKDIAEHLRRGDVGGSSFAFCVEDDEWREESGISVREIRSVRLLDCGPVTYPAYGSTTAGLRSSGDADEARKSFEVWEAKQADAAALAQKLAGYAQRAKAVG